MSFVSARNKWEYVSEIFLFSLPLRPHSFLKIEIDFSQFIHAIDPCTSLDWTRLWTVVSSTGLQETETAPCLRAFSPQCWFPVNCLFQSNCYSLPSMLRITCRHFLNTKIVSFEKDCIHDLFCQFLMLLSLSEQLCPALRGRASWPGQGSSVNIGILTQILCTLQRLVTSKQCNDM